jgi:hypothetical protein
MRGLVDLGILMITSSRACFQIPNTPPNRKLPVTVNSGDKVSASGYETTRDRWKSIQNHLLQLLMVLLRWGVGAFGAGSVRRGRRRAFRRIALGRGLRTKPGLRRQGQFL